MVFGFFKKDSDKSAEAPSKTASAASGDKSMFTGDRRISAEIDFGFGTFTWDDTDSFPADNVAPFPAEAPPTTGGTVEPPPDMGIQTEDPQTIPPPAESFSTQELPEFPTEQPPDRPLPDLSGMSGASSADTEPVINMDAMMMGPPPTASAPEPAVQDLENLDVDQLREAAEKLEAGTQDYESAPPDFGMETPTPDYSPTEDFGSQDFGMASGTADFGMETSPQDFPPTEDFSMESSAPPDFDMGTAAPDFGMDTTPPDFGMESPAQDYAMPEDFSMGASDTADFGMETSPQDSPPTEDFSMESTPPSDFAIETPTGDFDSQDFGMAADTADFGMETSPQDFPPTEDFSMESSAPPDFDMGTAAPDFGMDTTPPDFGMESPAQDYAMPEDFSMGASDTADFGMETSPQDFPPTEDFSMESSPAPDFAIETPTGDFDSQDFGMAADTADFGMETSPQDFPPTEDFSMESSPPPDFAIETPTGDFGSQDFGMAADTADFGMETSPQDFPPTEDFGTETEEEPEYSLESQFNAEIESARLEEPEFQIQGEHAYDSEPIADLSAPVQEDITFMPEVEPVDDLSWMPAPQGFQDFSVSMGDDFHDHAAPGFEPVAFEDTTADDSQDDTLFHLDETLYPSETQLDPSDLSGMIPNQDPFTAELPDMGLQDTDDEPVLELSPHLGEDIDAIERANRLLEESLNEPLELAEPAPEYDEALPQTGPELAEPPEEASSYEHAEYADAVFSQADAPAEAPVEESAGDEDFTVLDTCPISEESRLFMVAMNDIYALMGESGPPHSSNVEVLKVFQDNPLADNQIFQATRESAVGGKDMFLVQAGAWKGVISQDNDKVTLRTEINE